MQFVMLGDQALKDLTSSMSSYVMYSLSPVNCVLNGCTNSVCVSSILGEKSVPLLPVPSSLLSVTLVIKDSFSRSWFRNTERVEYLVKRTYHFDMLTSSNVGFGVYVKIIVHVKV